MLAKNDRVQQPQRRRELVAQIARLELVTLRQALAIEYRYSTEAPMSRSFKPPRDQRPVDVHRHHGGRFGHGRKISWDRRKRSHHLMNETWTRFARCASGRRQLTVPRDYVHSISQVQSVQALASIIQNLNSLTEVDYAG